MQTRPWDRSSQSLPTAPDSTSSLSPSPLSSKDKMESTVCPYECISLVLRSQLSKKGEGQWPCADFKSAQTDKGTSLCLHRATGIGWTDFSLNWLTQVGVLASFRHYLRVLSQGLSEAVSIVIVRVWLFWVNLPIPSKKKSIQNSLTCSMDQMVVD